MATDNPNFEFKLDFTLTPPIVEENVEVKPVMTDHETSVYNATPILFNPADYPLQEKDWHQKALEAKIKPENKKHKITAYKIGKVKIVYNGEEYKAELLTTMHGAGFQYWEQLYEKEIALAKAMCYAQHVVAYGNYGQIIPPQATEYFNLREVDAMKIREQQQLKEATVDIDFIK